MEQLQKQIEQLKADLLRLDERYITDINKVCGERDTAMIENEDLRQELDAFKKAFVQLLTSLMFPPPGVCWLGTGDQAMDVLIDQAIKDNGLTLAQAPHLCKVYVGYRKPKEE